MIYTIVQDPDIFSPDEFQNSPLYRSTLLSALKDWVRNCVIFVDQEGRLLNKVVSNIKEMEPQDKKNIKVLFEKYEKGHRFIKKSAACFSSNENPNDLSICHAIVSAHNPDAFIVSAKSSTYFREFGYNEGQPIVLHDYSSSVFCDEVRRFDVKIGRENDYSTLERVLRFAKNIKVFDRNIGRYWDKDYRESLIHLCRLYKDVGEFCNEGQIEIITGFVENKEEDKRKNNEKYADINRTFGINLEREFPFKVSITIKKETGYKILPHPRYLMTDQFILQLDTGFKFFNVVTDKIRENLISVKEVDHNFEWDYAGLLDYTPERTGSLTHNPFAQLHTKRRDTNVR